MGWVRTALRLPAVVVLTTLLMTLWTVGTGLFFFSTRARLAVRNLVFRTWARSLLRLCGAAVRVHGEAPTEPGVFVSNHLSYLDIPLLAASIDTVFVAKKEVRSWPVIGLICACMDTIFIDRTSRRDIPRVLAEIERAMALGHNVLIFPEGTSTRGAEVARFHPSLLEAAARSGRPVHAAALRYSTPSGAPPVDETICWWGGMTFTSHLLRLLSLPGFSAEISFSSTPIREDDRKLLAARLWEEVDRLFVPVVCDGR